MPTLPRMRRTRATSVLIALVEAWAKLAPADRGDADLRRTVVERVLRPAHEIATSERVPQDPSRHRIQLARAVANGYVRVKADTKAWDGLLEALGNDAGARAAAAALRP